MTGVIFRPDKSILLKDVRLSYPHLHELFAYKPADKPAYSATGLLPKSRKEDCAALINHIKVYMGQEFTRPLAANLLCMRDGDQSGKEEYAGMWSISARQTDPVKRPVVFDARKQRVTAADDVVYPGCWGDMLISLWPQGGKNGKPNPNGPRINANILGFQFKRDGERLSSEAQYKVEEAFDDEGGEAEAVTWGDDDAAF